MLFNSYVFLFGFLPATFVLFFAAARLDRRAALACLTLASLFFYGWWSTQYIWLILGSILFNYISSRFILQAHDAGHDRLLRLVLSVAIVGDLGLLGYYKYAGFFVSNVDALLGANWAIPNVVLPLGISFFTFTQIAFLVDTARGEAREAQFLPYALFVTYFPHLLAGPIIHHKAVMPQFQRPSTFQISYDNLAVGLTIFVIGLAKKVLIADPLIKISDPAFQVGHMPMLAEAWIGALGYTMRLYFDFSGYSDMAIGLSRLFGVELPINFNSPYKAASIVDFWRRWHMTLSAFLRDYLYIPLGGNRKGKLRRYENLFITMLLGGMWHGAGWTFVIWGGLHGLYLVVNHLWRAVVSPAKPSRVRAFAAWAATFLSVVVAWVFFRAPDITTAFHVAGGLFGANGIVSPRHGVAASFKANELLPLLFATFLALTMPNTQEIVSGFMAGVPSIKRVIWRPTAYWGIAVGLLFIVCVVELGQASEFIYYQF